MCQTGISAQILYTFCRIQKLASSVAERKKAKPYDRKQGRKKGPRPACCPRGEPWERPGRGCTPAQGCVPPHTPGTRWNISLGLYFSGTTVTSYLIRQTGEVKRLSEPGETVERNQVLLPTSQRSVLQPALFLPLRMKDISKKILQQLEAMPKYFKD